MTNQIHPARRARAFTGAASVVALVGIVAGLQLTAPALGAQQASVRATTGIKATPSIAPVPAAAAAQPVAPAAAPPAPAPAAPAPVQKAPAPAAAPAQKAPVVHAVTSGSGG